MRSPLGEWIRVPVLVARGLEDGPVLGLTAAVHGNELNGVPCIHRIISTIDVHKLKVPRFVLLFGHLSLTLYIITGNSDRGSMCQHCWVSSHAARLERWG